MTGRPGLAGPIGYVPAAWVGLDSTCAVWDMAPPWWRSIGMEPHSWQVCNSCNVAIDYGSCRMQRMSELGLRERKKQRTRQALRQAAVRLFLERGFEATTIADIAAAAEVAPRTFFSYYPTKEDVVLGE